MGKFYSKKFFKKGVISKPIQSVKLSNKRGGRCL